jgi:hypothetical protein
MPTKKTDLPAKKPDAKKRHRARPGSMVGVLRQSTRLLLSRLSCGYLSQVQALSQLPRLEA